MEAGIETDRNYLGEEVHRFSDCEAYQRSKCLSHDYQRERRKDAVKKAVHDKMDNSIDDQKKLDALHYMNNKPVAKLMKFLPRPHECLENQLNSITLDHVHKCYIDELKGFIHVRKFDSLKIPRHLKFKWPLKGDTEKAIAGETNLLSLAMDVRKSNVILPTIFDAPEPPPCSEHYRNTTRSITGIPINDSHYTAISIHNWDGIISPHTALFLSHWYDMGLDGSIILLWGRKFRYDTQWWVSIGTKKQRITTNPDESIREQDYLLWTFCNELVSQ